MAARGDGAGAFRGEYEEFSLAFAVLMGAGRTLPEGKEGCGGLWFPLPLEGGRPMLSKLGGGGSKWPNFS